MKDLYPCASEFNDECIQWHGPDAAASKSLDGYIVIFDMPSNEHIFNTQNFEIVVTDMIKKDMKRTEINTIRLLSMQMAGEMRWTPKCIGVSSDVEIKEVIDSESFSSGTTFFVAHRNYNNIESISLKDFNGRNTHKIEEPKCNQYTGVVQIPYEDIKDIKSFAGKVKNIVFVNPPAQGDHVMNFIIQVSLKSECRNHMNVAFVYDISHIEQAQAVQAHAWRGCIRRFGWHPGRVPSIASYTTTGTQSDVKFLLTKIHRLTKLYRRPHTFQLAFFSKKILGPHGRDAYRRRGNLVQRPDPGRSRAHGPHTET